MGTSGDLGTTRPVLRFYPNKIPSSRENQEILIQYVQLFIHQEAVISVQESEKFLGFYAPIFFVPQKTGGRRLEAGSRLKATKQIHQARTFQNGIFQFGNPSSTTGGLDGLYRQFHHNFQPFL